jgi:hypothetical protein
VIFIAAIRRGSNQLNRHIAVSIILSDDRWFGNRCGIEPNPPAVFESAHLAQGSVERVARLLA